jgi:hypothetical protein
MSMSTRAHGPTAGFHWLRRALQVGRHNPRALFAGAALLMAAWLLPNLVQALLHTVLQPGNEGAIVIAAVMTLLSVAILAPLMGGYLRLIHASEQGRVAHAREIFDVFRSGRAWRSCAGFGLLVLMVHVLVGYVLVSQFADGLMAWYVQVMTLLQQARESGAQAMPAWPPLPEGIGVFFALASLWALFIGGVFAVGLGQVALRGRGVRAAFADGLAGTAKNLLPLLVMAVFAFGAMVVAAVALAMVLTVVALVAGLVHPTLAAAVVLPLYLGFLAVVYALVFSVMYQVWRDVADPAAPGAPTTAAGNLEA